MNLGNILSIRQLPYTSMEHIGNFRQLPYTSMEHILSIRQHKNPYFSLKPRKSYYIYKYRMILSKKPKR